MISKFKEKPEGGYYCSECHMSFSDVQTTCPYCGSIVSNYEELVTHFNNGGFVSYDEFPLRGLRERANTLDDYIGDELDHELLKKVIEKLKENLNEGTIC